MKRVSEREREAEGIPIGFHSKRRVASFTREEIQGFIVPMASLCTEMFYS